MLQNKTCIPDIVLDSFKKYSQTYHVSMEKLWLSAFQVFLHRITQENRILVTAPFMDEGNWKVYSAEFDHSLTFSGLLSRDQDPQTGDSSVRITFQYGDESSIQTLENFTPNLSLKLGQNAVWGFDPMHYSAEEITCIPQISIHFVENLSKDFNRPCAQISLLAPEQWIDMESWNRTEVEFPSEASLHELISEQAYCSPQRIAAVYNGERLSYSEMEKQANGLARALIAAGVQAGNIVGLYVERDLELLIAQLAILKTGAAYAALDLQYPREMLARLFDSFDLPFILTHSKFKNLLPEHKSDLLLIDQLLSQPYHPTTVPEVIVNSRSAAFIIFTSGSTGVPKGVVHTHRNMLARFQAAWALAAMNTNDVISQTSPLSSIDAVDEIYSPFLLGARTVIIPHKIVTDPRRLVGLLEEEGVTRMVLVPSLL